MLTYRHEGIRISYANATGSTISSGDVVVMNSRFIGIAVADIANGDTGVVEVKRCHNLDAKTADSWSQGAKVYWDDTENELTDTVGTNPYAGTAAEAKTATTDTDIDILLNVYVPDPASA